jgi:hypothetical protein
MRASSPDFFDKARRFAAAGLLVAGSCAIVGSILDWVVITERQVAEDVDFGEDGDIEPGQGEAFAGVEDRDGWLTLGGGIGLVAAAMTLAFVPRPGYAWLSFWVSVAIGGIAFADYRAVAGAGERTVGIVGRQGVGAEAQPAIGLTLVAVAAVLGLISAVAAVAATPRER